MRFYVRRVAWFESLPAARRQAVADADSLWRAGRVVVGQEGVSAAMRLWRESLARAETAADTAARSMALYSIGAGHYMVGDLDSAQVYLDRARDLARAIVDHRSMGNIVGILASVSKDRGDLTRAAQQYEEALAIRPRSGDARGMVADQQNLGLVARELGDLDGAVAAFEAALALNRAAGRDRPAAVNLTNLGDIASIRGEYAVARSHYEEALALNRSAGDVAETGFVLHDLGMLATRSGDYPRALADLAAALEIHEEAGAVLDAVAVRTDLAAVQAATGDLARAIATLGAAQDAAVAAAAPAGIRARLALARADLALQFGEPARADGEYAAAQQLFTETGDEAGRAEAHHGRAQLLLLREDYAGALRLLELAAHAHAAAGDPRSAAITQLLAGDVHREVGDTAAARHAFDGARRAFERLGDAAGEAAALSASGDLALQRGAPLAAEALYRRGLRQLGARPVPDTRQRLHTGLAAALRQRGALAPAATELRAAIAVIEAVAAGMRSEERRSGFLADKWQTYASLAQVEQALGRASDAFEVSERMRARQMLALLDRGRVATRREPNAREQDLRRRIGELTGRMAGEGPDADGRREPALAGRSAEAVREALADAQRQYSELLLTLREDDAAYGQLVTAAFSDARAVAARLAPDQILLEYMLAESAATVFVVTPDTVAALELDVDRQTIAQLVDFARHAMDRPAGRSAPLWRGVLGRLHHYLIEPVERAGLLDGRQKLVIVPHAELHFLPFGALVAPAPSESFLVERFELTYAPSASAWVRLADRSAARSRRVLALAPHTARLPASGEEVAGIRSVHGRRGTTVLLGADATEAALREAASRYGVVHLATYGVLNKHNPLFSYVELAAGGDSDGRLEVHEVFDLELNGQLIVLSACQTAVASGTRADIPAGDEWVGLMQAFLQAGAASVLASLWPVDDRASAQLMERFHRALAAGRTDAAAITEAQRALLREPATAHPYYWAGFIMSGTRRRD